MKYNQKLNILVIIPVFLATRFILNGLSGNWSLIYLFKNSWIEIITMTIGFFFISFLVSKNKKENK